VMFCCSLRRAVSCALNCGKRLLRENVKRLRRTSKILIAALLSYVDSSLLVVCGFELP
jgi:hypothetical protein